MSDAIEHVLVVPTALFHEVGHFQGFQTETEPYLRRLLAPDVVRYEPRDRMETDPSFKQLIPYCLFRHDGKLFHYRRGGGQGEARLHGKRSVGVGGHICTLDENKTRPAYEEGLRREIDEEVYLEAEYTRELVGMINDDETEVGAVHLGLVHCFELDTPGVRPKEAEMIEAGFAAPQELLNNVEEFESWSQIVLQALFGDH